MIIEEILNKIKELGEVRGFNQAEIAEIIGCTTIQVWDIINRIHTVKKMQKDKRTLNPRGVKYLDFDCIVKDDPDGFISIKFNKIC